MTESRMAVAVVEDKGDWRQLIRRQLVDFRKGDPKFDLTSVSTFEDFLALQQTHRFDVVVIDLWLEGQQFGLDPPAGLDVLRSIRLWNPEAVVVVFTGAPRFEHCVAAMRAGAWDYIAKNSDPKGVIPISGGIALLEDSIDAGLSARDAQRNTAASWFIKRLPDFVKQYAGQYIACAQQEVLDSDADLERLRTRVRGRPTEGEPVFFLIPEEWQ